MPAWSWCLRGECAQRDPIHPVPALEAAELWRDACRGETGRFPFDVRLGDIPVAGADRDHERRPPECGPEAVEREVGRHAAGPEDETAGPEPAEPEPPARGRGALGKAVDFNPRVPGGPAEHAVGEQVEIAEVVLDLDLAVLLGHPRRADPAGAGLLEIRPGKPLRGDEEASRPD